MKRREIIAVLGITVALTLTIASVKGYNANKKNEIQSAAVNVEDNISSTTEESVTDISSVAEKDVAVEEQDNSKSEIAVSQTEGTTDNDVNNAESNDLGEDEEPENETINEVVESEEAVVEDTEPETPALDYEIEKIDDTIMYAKQDCNVRKGPSTDYDKVGSLSLNEEVTVNGKVTADNGKVWYVLKSEDEGHKMVAGSLLSTTKVTAQAKSKTSDSGNSSKSYQSSQSSQSYQSSQSSQQQSQQQPQEQAQPTTPSDCVADCDYGDCEGYCDCVEGLTYSSGYGDCSTAWCPEAE